MRAGDALALLHLPRRARAVREPLVHHAHLGAPIVPSPRVCGANEPIEDGVHERVAQLGVVEICEDREPKAPIRNQADDGRASFDAAGVDRDELAAIILQDPAQAVRLEVRVGQRGGGIERALHDLLRPKQLREVLRADKPAAGDSPAVEQEAQPLGHVGRGREDRAGRRDIIDALERRGQHAHRVAHDAVRRGDVGDPCRAQLARVGDGLRHA